MKFKKILILIISAISVTTMHAQIDLGKALGKIGSAIEKRYKSQTEKEKEIEYQNRRTTYYDDKGYFEVDDIYYDCSPSSRKATVTSGITEIRKETIDENDPEKTRWKTEQSYNHKYIKKIHIPDYVLYKETDKKGRIITSADCKVTNMERRAFYGTIASSAWITGNVNIIPEEAFYNSKIEYLTLNEGVQNKSIIRLFPQVKILDPLRCHPQFIKSGLTPFHIVLHFHP